MAARDVVLTHGGARVPALVVEPDDAVRNGAAVVVAAEAFGINAFTRDVAGRLAALGYVVVAPDYYRGHGLTKPDDYSDFAEVMGFIDVLDFGGATKDMLAGIDFARSLPGVDPSRVVVWGYCTGGTLAMLATALDRRLAGAVWFFPSQPSFPELGPARPVHAVDMIWAITCPVLLLYGDQDPVLVEAGPEIVRRFEQWGVAGEVEVYPGAGHAFSSPGPGLHHREADAGSWRDATAFVQRVTG